MGSFAPQSVYSNTPSPQTGAGLAALASNQEAIMELPGAQAPQNIEISDNALTFSATPVSAYLIVDTEGQAAADDLEVINPVVSATDNLHDGMLLHLQAADAGRTVTVVNSSSANGIQTVGGGNITLTTNTWCVLQLRSGTWYEISSTQAQTIDGVEFNGTAGITHATTCDTAAATAAKTATLDGFTLIAGAEVTVKFINGNTASNPTLNISNTGAAPILYQGVALTDASIGANTVCRLYYDGTAWNIVGIVTAPATTSSLGTARLATQAEVQAGAAASGSLTPAVLRVDDIQLAGPLLMYNTRTVLTTSGSWTAPVTGWYRLIIIGGGGGGGGAYHDTWQGHGRAMGGCGGSSGERLEYFIYLSASTIITFTIGAGGAYGQNTPASTAGLDGGATSLTVGTTSLTAMGGIGGMSYNSGAGKSVGSGLSCGTPGGINGFGIDASGLGGHGGGPGGGVASIQGATDADGVGFGAGGAGGTARSGGSYFSPGNGMQGCIAIYYFDPNVAAA